MTLYGRPDEDWDALVDAAMMFLRTAVERDTSYTEMNVVLSR